MNKFGRVLILLLVGSFSQLGLAADPQDNWEASQQFKKTPEVLPQGARLVAGNARHNEFYILGRMSVEPEQPKIEKKIVKIAKTHTASKKQTKKTLAATKTKRIASKHKAKGNSKKRIAHHAKHKQALA